MQTTRRKFNSHTATRSVGGLLTGRRERQEVSCCHLAESSTGKYHTIQQVIRCMTMSRQSTSQKSIVEEITDPSFQSLACLSLVRCCFQTLMNEKGTDDHRRHKEKNERELKTEVDHRSPLRSNRKIEQGADGRQNEKTELREKQFRKRETRNSFPTDAGPLWSPLLHHHHSR